MKHRSWGACVGLGLFIGASAGQAAAIEPYQDYRKHIESAQNLTALKV